MWRHASGVPVKAASRRPKMSAGPEARHTGTPEACLYITAAAPAVGSGQERCRLATAEKETGGGTAPLHYGEGKYFRLIWNCGVTGTACCQPQFCEIIPPLLLSTYHIPAAGV